MEPKDKKPMTIEELDSKRHAKMLERDKLNAELNELAAELTDLQAKDKAIRLAAELTLVETKALQEYLKGGG